MGSELRGDSVAEGFGVLGSVSPFGAAGGFVEEGHRTEMELAIFYFGEGGDGYLAATPQAA